MKFLTLFFSLLVTVLLWCLPSEIFGMGEMSIIEQRVLAIFIFAALFWVFEIIPIWATSILIILVLLLTVSDSAFLFLRSGEVGELVSHRALIGTFADPIIMLFLGGFSLAIAAEKSGLDKNLMRVLFKPFGSKSHFVLLGLMVATAFFSCFMSNTATTAMMFAIIAPVIVGLDDAKGKIALALAIPFAANIGGLGTPIGTPPNAIAMKYLNDPDGINMGLGFGGWMLIMIPLVVLTVIMAWLVLIKIFPFRQERLDLNFGGKFATDVKSWIVYITFAGTVLLWMLDKWTGLNPSVVAIIPFAVFCSTGIMRREDLRAINWEIFWLFAGGFALGLAADKSGLLDKVVASIPFAQWPPMLVLVGAGLLCYALSTFISNTATAALLIPVLVSVCLGMKETLAPLGGAPTVILGVAAMTTLAMALPISTPPNAIAYATGLVSQRQMALVGLLIALLGGTLAYGGLILYAKF